jgi:hypothetical protein
MFFRFYYDIKMQDCLTSDYGKCDYNLNKFASLTMCHSVCRGKISKTIINIDSIFRSVTAVVKYQCDKVL